MTTIIDKSMDEYFSTDDNWGNSSFLVSNVGPNIEGYEEYFSNDKPIRKRVFIAQELVQNDHPSPRILRQYSYQEIHNSSSPLIKYTSFVEPGYIKQINSGGCMSGSNFCTQEEPMEVDTSLDCSNNTCNADVSECKETKFSSNCTSTQDIIYHRKTQPKTEGQNSSPPRLDKLFVKKRRKEIPLLVRLILAVILIGASLMFVVYMVFDYNAYVDLDALENEFALRLHEQKDAVHAVVNSLRYNHPHAQWHKPVKILNFVGRSGVGKTFIANIVKLHFNYLFVNDLHSSELHNIGLHDSVIENLQSRYMNLIVVDDLNVDDLNPLIHFIKKLEKHEALVLVIAIFSIQKVDDDFNSEVYYEDIVTIHKKFDKTGFYHEVIVFDEFTTADAREYIGKKLNSFNVPVQHHNKVASGVLQDHDINRDGFKDLLSKVLVKIHRPDLT